ncbi:hypothetical protein [Burkholderia metallica]|nr:hypothetical protein [Burkholderia metallica]MCA7998009.1 hypothetical protein [Burkholderia metallica]
MKRPDRTTGRFFFQSVVEGVTTMTQMMLNLRAAVAAPVLRSPAGVARYVVGFAIVVGGAAELVSQALHALAPFVSAAGG